LQTEPVAASPLLDNLRIFHTGEPPDSTGSVVASVRSLRELMPSRIEAALVRIETATLALHDALLSSRQDARAVIAAISLCQAGLEELSVVPKPVRDLVRKVELEGGAAKISGAGSAVGPGAGCLLVYHPEPERISGWSFLEGLSFYPVRLGAAGLRDEGTERMG
jgi:mevalonate kinase